MEALTAEQIAQRCDHLYGQANIAAINRLFRAQDDSHRYPIRGRFDATERAIRKIRQRRAEGYGPADGLEYAVALESEIGSLVNCEM